MRAVEVFRQAINRLLRPAAHGDEERRTELPTLPGAPVADITDVSAALAQLDDEHPRSPGAA